MRRRVRRVIEILAVVLLLAAIPYGYYRWRSSNALNEILAELDASGEPWKLVDLEARRKNVDDDKNAAVLIKKARLPGPPARWRLKLPLDELKLAPNEVLHPAEQIKFREFLDNFGENLEAVRDLADYPEGSFYVKIAPDVISTSLPHVQDVRELGVVLRHDVWWRAQQADFEGAARSVQAAIHASRTLRDELFPVSHLVRLAMLRDAATSVERIIGQGQAPFETLAALQKQFQEEAEFDSFTRAMQGERAGMHQLFEHLAANKVDVGMVRRLMGARRNWDDSVTDVLLGATAEQSHAWMLRHMTDMLATRKLAPPQRAARLKELSDGIQHAPALAKTLTHPWWNNAYSGFPRAEAKLGCTVAGLAAERFRQKHKRWPKTLDELTPEFVEKLPQDPYTGEALQLRGNADGIVIFSPGPDGVLRGAGRDQPLQANEDQNLDHEFRLWDVDQRRRGAK